MKLSLRTAKTATAWLGIIAFGWFLVALVLFSFLNSEFSLTNDFVSELGAIGQPYALAWNLIGFVSVGLLLFGFGLGFGIVNGDRLAGILLAIFGIGFAFAAIPIDLNESGSPVSKAHVVAICLALACWLFGLARISANQQYSRTVRLRANIAAIALVGAMIGSAFGIWSMPVTHRLVFGVVFGWTLMTGIGLHLNPDSMSNHSPSSSV